MESVGKFEFNRKDLIGHGAFAVVFKGRHKEKPWIEVAVKCINKKTLAKSHSLLGKEIKILKELKHENIVRLLDYQEQEGYVYLVMEYCNGGDLAEYLQSKGTLSEDTIRVFLQQIAQAMNVLQSKGILHRDLKPQNILLCRPTKRRSGSTNTCIKIADFGFARHLQTNTMAATLCGSPMYMAPEVIMSQNYDSKADLWSIGTIVYQSLTGKAPFYARTPQELRLFYECNRTLVPSIPKETSSNLRNLLLRLLQRNHKDRISFEEFSNHPFLESSPSIRKCPPAPVPPSPSPTLGSSSSSSSTSHLASPQLSGEAEEEMHQLKPKLLPSPTKETLGFQPKETAKQNGRNLSSSTDDYVMVPARLPSECICEKDLGSPIESCLLYSGSLKPERGLVAEGRTPPPSPLLHCPSKPVSKPDEFAVSNRCHSEPIPVPTQIRNYQRIEQKLQPVGSHGYTTVRLSCAGSSNENSPQFGGSELQSPGLAPYFSRLAAGGARPKQSSPRAGFTPPTSKQTPPLSTRNRWFTDSPDTKEVSSPKVHSRMQNQLSRGRQSPNISPASQTDHSRKPANTMVPFKRSPSTARLSEMLLKTASGDQLAEQGSDESLGSEKTMETTGSPSSASPPGVVFTMGSSQGNTPPDTVLSRIFRGSPSYTTSAWLLNSRLLQHKSRINSENEAMDITPYGSQVFHPPEFPEDTLMEQAHTEALSDLRFTLAFVHCVIELASSKKTGLDTISSPDVSFLEQSLVTDQISLLSREWSYAEKLVLYMKAVEFLSAALHTAKEQTQQGRLFPSSTVKQVIRKLNELYKSCVTSCRSLNDRLQNFLVDKQKLMDRLNGLRAEKLIYNHSVHMVQSAALDEMFHRGAASVHCYHKAFLLMEGVSRILTDQKDIDRIDKCKQCIERRLSALQI